jgi:hypothetical protein
LVSAPHNRKSAEPPQGERFPYCRQRRHFVADGDVQVDVVRPFRAGLAASRAEAPEQALAAERESV